MRMITHRHRQRNGCWQYEIRDYLDQYVGWLSREYAPWITLAGKVPDYEWQMEFNGDLPGMRLDDKCFKSFHEAKGWITDNVI